MDRETYRVKATRAGGWWDLEVPAVSGAHSQCRRLDQAEGMAREAIALFLDVPEDSFDVEVQASLDLPVLEAIDDALKLRRTAEAEAKRATEATDRVVRELLDKGLTLRDVGHLLGVSYQRVQQMADRARAKA